MRLLSIPVLLATFACTTTSPAPVEPDDFLARVAAEERKFHADGEGWVSTWGRRGRHAARITDRGVALGSAGLLVRASSPGAVEGACTDARDLLGDCVRRLEYRGEGGTEWWTRARNGVQQGFEFTEPTDALSVDIVLEGANHLAISEGAGSFVDDDGVAWNVDHIVAWDADRRWLPVTISATGDTLTVDVDTRTATWPVSVDPIYTTADFTGTVAGEDIGARIAGAGDLNGDGHDDLAVGVPGSNTVYLWYGDANGLTTGAPDDSLTGSGDFGYAVHIDCDINGDGFADIIVGAPTYNNGGSVDIYHGSASGPVAARRRVSSDDYERYGESVGCVDYNGDGYDDLLAGAPGHDLFLSANAGYAELVPGSASGLSSTGPGYFNGADSLEDVEDDYVGERVLGLGDVNGDGYEDFAVGSPQRDAFAGATQYENKGRVHIVYGQAFIQSGNFELADVADRQMSGQDQGDRLGFSLAAGDFNGDGYADIAVGAPYEDWSGDSNRGRVRIRYGSASGFGRSDDVILEGSNAGDYFGWSLASLGDADDDGYDDLAIGAPNYDANGANSGRVWIYSGSAGGIQSATTTLSGTAASEQFGYALAPAGLPKGFGFPGLFIGAPGAGTQGEVRWYDAYAQTGDADGDGVPPGSDCDDNDPTIWSPTTFYPDDDGDGYGNADCTTLSIGCTLTSSDSLTHDDCDDDDRSVHPGATEVCDAANVDEDCDGAVDDDDDDVDLTDAVLFYAGADGDGHGADTNSTLACDLPNLHVATAGDCDDADAEVYTGATEVCDDVDNDCDTLTDDEDDVIGQVTWFRDRDFDGYGVDTDSVFACFQEGPWATLDGDCDDEDDTINPAAYPADDDADGICNVDDVCPDDALDDADGDGFCDSDDPCLGDALNDLDGDGVCGGVDVCPGLDDANGCSTLTVAYDASRDADGDGTWSELTGTYASFDWDMGTAPHVPVTEPKAGQSYDTDHLAIEDAWRFDGDDVAIRTATDAAMATGPVTVELWFRNEIINGAETAVLWETGDSANGLSLTIQDYTLTAWLGGDSVSGSYTFEQSEDFIQVAAVADLSAGTLALYVNGSLAGSGTTTATAWSSSNAAALGGRSGAASTDLGGHDDTADAYGTFHGDIALFRLNEEARTAAQLETAYNDVHCGAGAVDTDGDGVCHGADLCPLDNPDDSDGDSVCDSEDVCPGGEDLFAPVGDLGADAGTWLALGDTCTGTNSFEHTCGLPGGQDLTYTWTPTTDASYTFSVGTDIDIFDTVLHVRSAEGCEADQLICRDNGNLSAYVNSSSLTFAGDAGTTYYVVVDSWSSNQECGVFDLFIACTNDQDGDGVCDEDDTCPDDVTNADGDGDGVCDSLDQCQGEDDTADADDDGVPDACDTCYGLHNNSDADGDGICDDVDVCDGSDDALDSDGDGTPDGCDVCPADPDDDSDGDGVCDTIDLCVGANDTADADGDGTPDACDLCEGDDLFEDADADGFCGDVDVCVGDDLTGDSDADGTCDDLDFSLVATTPTPGSAMTFTASNAVAGSRVYFLVSPRTSNGTCHPTATTAAGEPLCATLRAPTLLGSAIADMAGTATYSQQVPASLASGVTFYAQAMALDGTTGDVTERETLTTP